MAVWLVRAGSYGEYEQKFISEKRIYATWEKLSTNLSHVKSWDAFILVMTQHYPEAKPKTALNWASQVYPFAGEMKKGDLVVLPLKTQPAVQVGEITGDYQFDPAAEPPFFHFRQVKWVGEAIPRSHFGKDLLFSFGAFMTICRIKRNKAEDRIRKMLELGWQPEQAIPTPKPATATGPTDESTDATDLEALAQDQIAELIMAKFKGHGLARLVEAVLRAQGYVTYRSPEGPDGGADILAGSGALGFSAPRLCVEVKSGDSPVDRAAVDKLLGAVTKFGANEGLFVSWSGFKSTVFKEMAPSFFKVRLWTQNELLEALFSNYNKLDADIRAELPLKQIWTVTMQTGATSE